MSGSGKGMAGYRVGKDYEYEYEEKLGSPLGVEQTHADEKEYRPQCGGLGSGMHLVPYIGHPEYPESAGEKDYSSQGGEKVRENGDHFSPPSRYLAMARTPRNESTE